MSSPNLRSARTPISALASSTALAMALATLAACGDDGDEACETSCAEATTTATTSTTADGTTSPETPDDDSSTGPDDDTTTGAGTTTTGEPEGSSTGEPEGTSTGDAESCAPGTELVADGGFEAGYAPNPNWTLDSDAYADDLIADAEYPSKGWPAQAADGTFWLWLGSSPGGDSADASQDIELPSGSAALTFDLYLGFAPVTETDRLEVYLGEDLVWELAVADAEPFVDGYMAVSVDVSEFADGTNKALRFHADIAPNAAWGGGSTDPLTQYLVDNVSLVCE